MVSMKILCVDDDSIQLELLNHYFKESKMNVQAHYYHNSEEFFFGFEDHQDCDAIFLDVEMPGLNGFEIAKRIREYNQHVMIVFITAYPQYAIQGYEVFALDYILKPISQTSINSILDKISSLKKRIVPTFIFETEEGSRVIELDDICVVEAMGRESIIHLLNEELIVKEGFSTLNEKLGNTFIPIHRSYSINLNNLQQYTKEDILMDNGKTYPISRRMAKDVISKIVKHHQEQGYRL